MRKRVSGERGSRGGGGREEGSERMSEGINPKNVLPIAINRVGRHNSSCALSVFTHTNLVCSSKHICEARRSMTPVDQSIALPAFKRRRIVARRKLQVHQVVDRRPDV